MDTVELQTEGSYIFKARTIVGLCGQVIKLNKLTCIVFSTENLEINRSSPIAIDMIN